MRSLLFFLLIFSAKSSFCEDSIKNGIGNNSILFGGGMVGENFSLPFKDFRSHFVHPGISISSSISLNSKERGWLTLSAGVFQNSKMGNGLFLKGNFQYKFSQLPFVIPFLGIGLGWQKVYHPVPVFAFENGNWTQSKGGKSLLVVPFHIGLEISGKKKMNRLHPYLQYEVMPALFYNNVLPLSFYSMIEAGVKFKFH